MKNVHLLQTEVYPAKLQLDRDYGTLKILDEPCVINGQDFVGANLYITSDEEIKDVRPHKGKWQLEQGQILNKFPNYLTDLSECKLVIMTTDVRLIKDGVQAIDDEFLDWFIKNQKREIPIITTTVNNESHYTTNIGFESWRKEEPQQVCENCKIEISKYGCACGKQAHPKQETLEEAAEIDLTNLCYYDKRNSNCSVDDEDIEDHKNNLFKKNKTCSCDNCFYGRSKLTEQLIRQQERMYSEEEVWNLCNELASYFIGGDTFDLQEWFEQFKKNSNGNK